MTQTKNFFQRMLFIYGVSLVMVFFSELFFLNDGVVIDFMASMATVDSLFIKIFELGIWYFLAIAPVVLVLEYFRVSNVWSLFLAGSIAGLTIEGLVVPAMYFELPFSILWVAMSWHPIVNVLFGLWIFQIILRQRGFLQNLGLAALMGVVWGAWATYVVGGVSDVTEEVMGYYEVTEFGLYTLTATLVVFIGNLFLVPYARRTYRSTKVDWWVIGALSAGLFVLMTLMVSYLVIVPVIMATIFYLGLRKSRQQENNSKVLELFHQVPSWRNLFAIWVMPVTATLMYAVMAENSWQVEAWLVAFPLIIAGVYFFCAGMVKLHRSTVKPLDSSEA